MGFVVLFLRKAGPSDLIPFYNNVLAFSVYCMLYMQYEEKGAIFIFTILEKKKPRLNNLGEVTELILQSWDRSNSISRIGGGEFFGYLGKKTKAFIKKRMSDLYKNFWYQHFMPEDNGVTYLNKMWAKHFISS